MTAKLFIRYLEHSEQIDVEKWDVPKAIEIILEKIREEGNIPIFFSFSRQQLDKTAGRVDRIQIHTSDRFYIATSTDQLIHLGPEIEKIFKEKVTEW